jgi:hypothetical protein
MGGANSTLRFIDDTSGVLIPMSFPPPKSTTADGVSRFADFYHFPPLPARGAE